MAGFVFWAPLVQIVASSSVAQVDQTSVFSLFNRYYTRSRPISSNFNARNVYFTARRFN